MPLLNYTTTVPVGRTAAKVQELLAKAGARQIGFTYDEGGPVGVAFALGVTTGYRSFELPVDTEKVLAVLKRDRSTPPRYSTPEQAARVAWRIVKDWLEAQLAIIATEMVTLEQVMLPYMRGIEGKTLYELYRENQLPELGAG